MAGKRIANNGGKANNKGNSSGGRKQASRKGKGGSAANVRLLAAARRQPDIVAALKSAMLYPCGPLHGLQYLPGPAGRIIFRSTISLAYNLATTTTNVSGVSWGATVPTAWKVNHPNVVALFDPFQGTLGLTSLYGDTYYANGTTSNLTEVVRGASMSFPTSGGQARVVGACLRLRYTGTSANRSGYAIGASSYREDFSSRAVDTTGFDVPSSNLFSYPTNTIAPGVMVGHAGAVQQPDGVEVVCDMSLGDELVHDFYAVQNAAGVPITPIASGNRAGRPICMAALMGQQPGASVMVTAHAIYEWIPNVSGNFEFADSNASGTSSLKTWFDKALAGAKQVNWVRAYNSAATIARGIGGGPLRIEL